MIRSMLNDFCKHHRLDRSSNGGGILLYVRDDIPSQLLTDYKIKGNLELFFVEVNIWKKSAALITHIKIMCPTTYTI